MDGRKGETSISRVTRPMLQSAKCLFAERPEREDTPAAQRQDSGLDLDGVACAIRFLWRSMEHTCWA
jgi:hypothetical protein